MNNFNIKKALHFIFIVLLQVLVLKNMSLGKVNIYLYPIIILLLPLEIPHGLLVLLGFVCGLSIDIFYDTLGLHAAVMTLIAFARPGVCYLIEPRGGYEAHQSLTRSRLGWTWFSKYAGIIFGLSILLITLLEDLSFSMVWLVRFSLSYSVSMAFLMLYQSIFNPE
jgi:hypothetical protein